MSYHVTITESARNDLYAIYQYIAKILLEPQIAMKQIEQLEQQISSLEHHPERFRLYDENRWHQLRFVTVNRYVIFYKVEPEQQVVTIVRILYGGRNISTELD